MIDWKKVHAIPPEWRGRQFAKFLRPPTHTRKNSPYKITQDYLSTALPLGALTLGEKEVSENAGLMSYSSDDHLLTIAPSRAGKGTSQIIPTLLTYEGSTMVIDIKGENHAITGKHRASFKDGAKVFKFAPFENDTMKFNPLDYIHGQAGDPDSHKLAYDDCVFLSELMIPGQSGNESFWVTDARNLLAAILLHVKTSPEYSEGGNMAAVCKVFSNPLGLKARLDEIIDTAQERDHNELVMTLLGMFAAYEDKVLKSVQSTAVSELRCWFSEPVQNATERSNFNFLQLKKSMLDDDAPTTVYIVFPPEHVRGSKNLLRTIVGISIFSMLRDKRKPKLPVLYLLDEFPSLGYMPAVLDGLAYLAGYGVQFWTFAQTIGQLRAIYGEAWQTFTASAGMFSAFNINDIETSEYIARLLGKTDEYQQNYTVMKSSYEKYSPRDIERMFEYQKQVENNVFMQRDYGKEREFIENGGYEFNEGSNKYERLIEKPHKEQRFTSDEIGPPNMVRQLGDRFALVFIKGTKPALIRKIDYYKVKGFKGKYGKW